MAQDLDTAVERAHLELWTRFIHADGVILDYADRDGKVVLPTPEECAAGKPNALAWWTPIENGAFFNGLYLPAACERWRRTQDPADREKARRIARGLLHLAEVSDVPGFIARGCTADGKSHYPLGSDDQTHPWFYGLYFYAQSGVPDADERATVVRKMDEVAGVLHAAHWQCPCDGPMRGQVRGGFTEPAFRAAAACRSGPATAARRCRCSAATAPRTAPSCRWWCRRQAGTR